MKCQCLSSCFTKRPGTKGMQLINASKVGDVSQIKQLLEQNADVHEQNRFGRTALHYASRFGHTEAVRVLLKDGRARTDVLCKNCSSVAHECCRFGNAPTLRLLLTADSSLIHCLNTNGSLPIHVAAFSDNVDCVRVLAEMNAGLSVRNKKGMLPLHIACENNLVEVALALLRRSPQEQLLVRDAYDCLPLHLACQNAMQPVVLEMLRLLCALNSMTPVCQVLHTPDYAGGSPLDYIAKRVGFYPTTRGMPTTFHNMHQETPMAEFFGLEPHPRPQLLIDEGPSVSWSLEENLEKEIYRALYAASNRNPDPQQRPKSPEGEQEEDPGSTHLNANAPASHEEGQSISVLSSSPLLAGGILLDPSKDDSQPTIESTKSLPLSSSAPNLQATCTDSKSNSEPGIGETEAVNITVEERCRNLKPVRPSTANHSPTHE